MALDKASLAPAIPQTPLPPWFQRAIGTPPRTHGVMVEGASIAYRSWNLAAASLPAVLLVHGFQAHAGWWDHIGPFLAETHRVAALSFSGMGDSARRPIYARRQYSRELLAVAQDAGFLQPAVVAHSFGGSVAVMAASLAPEFFFQVVLIDSVLAFRGTREQNGHAERQRFYPDYDSAMQRFRLIPPGLWPDAHVLAHIARHSVAETAQGWTWKFDPAVATAIDGETMPSMAHVSVPFTYIYGEHSEIVSPDIAAEIVARFPNCKEALRIPGSHHHVMIEQPLALVAALRALLTQTSHRR